MKTKKCTRCGEEKPVTLDFFHRKGKYFRSECKVCRLKIQKEYRQTNREEILKKKKQYREANREAIAEYMKQYRETNREEIYEKRKQYREVNREAIKLRKKQYYQANREEILERTNRYYQANQKARAEYHKQYYQTRKDEQPACIYQIINTQNGRIYVGETIRGELRWKEHLSELRGGFHENSNIQEDFNRFGEEAFKWSIIKEVPKDKEILIYEEIKTISSFLKEGKNLYNLSLTIDQLIMLQESENNT